MDIKRDTSGRKWRRIIYGAVALVAVVLITVGLSRLERAAPTVDEATLWIQDVERGEMLLERRGPGTLVPEEIRAITARTAGQVQEIVLLPGAEVQPDTVILRLSNPDVVLNASNARWELEAARADLRDLGARLETQRLQQRSNAAQVEAAFKQARLRADRDRQLFEESLISDLTRQISVSTAEELQIRHEIEQERTAKLEEQITAQLDAQRTRVDQLEARYQLAQEDLAALDVNADMNGLLQEMPMEVGQSVTAGQVLARVVQPDKLKAELRIPETQAKDIRKGQKATIDIRTDTIPGEVTRIDPAAQQGTVTVDVKLLADELPEGARPQLSVDGTVEITRLDDVLYTGKPAFGQSNSTVSLFKITEDGTHAVRTTVELGLASVNLIEVKRGLQEGDRVILSDMSRWDSVDRVRLQ